MKTLTKTSIIAGVVIAVATGGAFAAGKGENRGMRAADTNNDRVITQEEFTAHFISRISEFDSNSDGVINQAELQAVTEASDDNRMQRRASRIRALDADWNGELTTAEITAASVAAFERADSNDDGQLDRSDRKGKRGKGKGKRGGDRN
jgi:Ca2+-binding EF-hand superfamily protein